MEQFPESPSCMVQAGHLAYSEDPAYICAVCGNGVVVTLRNRNRKMGGMAHCVYPRLKPGERATNFHVDIALNSLIKVMDDATRRDATLEAQLFGGGHRDGLGQKRAEEAIRMVKRILREQRIEIVSEDVGGTLGRKVIFNSQSGETLVVKTSRIRHMDWMPEWEYQIGVKRIAYSRETREARTGRGE